MDVFPPVEDEGISGQALSENDEFVSAVSMAIHCVWNNMNVISNFF